MEQDDSTCFPLAIGCTHAHLEELNILCILPCACIYVLLCGSQAARNVTKTTVRVGAYLHPVELV